MDEIVVLDSGSGDRTVEICESFGARVEYAAFRDFAEQKNRALELCTHDWAFNLDADEELSPELRISIGTVLAGRFDNNGPTAYKVSRRNRYLGRWIRHCGWYPELRTRLSLKGASGWTGEVLHESLETEGPTGVLSGDLLHRPYRDLGDHLKVIARYTSLWAEREARSGRTTGLFDVVTRPVAKFLKMYIIRAGFLDAGPGLIASLMGSWYTFMKYARLYELNRAGVYRDPDMS